MVWGRSSAAKVYPGHSGRGLSRADGRHFPACWVSKGRPVGSRKGCFRSRPPASEFGIRLSVPVVSTLARTPQDCSIHCRKVPLLTDQGWFSKCCLGAMALGQREAFPGFVFVHGLLLFNFKCLFTCLLGTVILKKRFSSSLDLFPSRHNRNRGAWLVQWVKPLLLAQVMIWGEQKQGWISRP